MNKLSVIQSGCLVLINGGNIVNNHDTSELSLIDNEDNEYYIRRSTFNVLLKNEYIGYAFSPALGISKYYISEKGITYLHENHKHIKRIMKKKLKDLTK